ncbi:MAG: hypothetical protein OMM_07686, partial [Candidatus Magnetoglobus multicellularis str. Araruama]
MITIKKLLLLLLGIAINMCFFSHVFALSNPLSEQKVIPENPTANACYGSAVAISDKYAIIGSKKDGQVADKGGSAYIYEKIGGQWELQQKFVGEKDGVGDYLGLSVTLTGNYAFAGASSYNLDDSHKDVGVVYVYYRQTSGEWVQFQKLVPDPIEGTHNFGTSLAVSNNQLIVGAYGNTSESGKAFIFELDHNNQWIQRHCLEPDEPDIKGRFGNSVDIYENYAIVGAYIGFGYKGAAYIFQKENGSWQQKQLMIAPYDDNYSYFGYSVGINNQYAVVSAYGESRNGYSNAGTVYIYQKNADVWELMSELFENDLQKSDKFGVSLDLKENILAVGATKMDSDIVDSGAVFIYWLGNDCYTKQRKIVPGDPITDSLFGSSVSIFGNDILIGNES